MIAVDLTSEYMSIDSEYQLFRTLFKVPLVAGENILSVPLKVCENYDALNLLTYPSPCGNAVVPNFEAEPEKAAAIEFTKLCSPL